MARSHRRGPWVPEEDQTLLQLVREQGPNNWVRISQHMHFRSPKQCRERFHQNLKPSLNHAPISAEEGLLIERMVEEMGKRWAEIARRLGNRSDNAVKNWWNGSINRKRRGGGSGHHGQVSRISNGRIETPYPRTSSSLTEHRKYRTASDQSRRSSWNVTSPHTDEDPVPTYPEPYPSRSLLRHPASSLDGHRYSSYQDDSHTPPTYQSDLFSSRDDLNRLPPITTIATSTTSKNYEPAMTSPAFSETSNTASMGPPSMVSDHTSISSASPRTAASPQVVSSSIPITRYLYGERRGSAPPLHAHSPTDLSTADHGLMLGTHSLDGTKSLDYTATPYPGPTLPPLQHRHSNSASDSTIPPVREDRFPHRPTPAPLQPTRDSRMGLNSLLNQD